MSPDAGQLFEIGPTQVPADSNVAAHGLDASGSDGLLYATRSWINVFFKRTHTDIFRVEPSTGTFRAVSSWLGFSYDFAFAPPSVVSAAADATSVPEGATATVIVTRTNPGTGPVAVDYATRDGSATAGGDFTAQSGTVTFTEGQTSQAISVPTQPDNATDAGETFDIVLANPRGSAQTRALLQRSVTTVAIDGDNAPQPAPQPGPQSAPRPPVTPTVDRIAPAVKVAGVRSTVRRSQLLRGLRVKLTPSESTSFDVQLLGKRDKSYSRRLWRARLGLSPRTRSIRVRPKARLLGRVRKAIRLRLRILATDARGNRRTVYKTITVKPDRR